MAEKTIIIEIDEAGNSSLHLNGFQGKGCCDVAKLLNGSDRVIRSHNKREFNFVSQKQNSKLRQRS
jgi:hypothetical protein